jgi:hypothetical protein
MTVSRVALRPGLTPFLAASSTRSMILKTARSLADRVCREGRGKQAAAAQVW